MDLADAAQGSAGVDAGQSCVSRAGPGRRAADVLPAAVDRARGAAERRVDACRRGTGHAGVVRRHAFQRRRRLSGRRPVARAPDMDGRSGPQARLAIPVGVVWPDGHIPSEWMDRSAVTAPMDDSRRGLGVYYRYHPRPVERLCHDYHADVFVDRPKIHESVLERIRQDVDGYAPVVLPERYAVRHRRRPHPGRRGRQRDADARTCQSVRTSDAAACPAVATGAGAQCGVVATRVRTS